MTIPTTQRLSGREANITAESDDFVTIDLDNYEKNVGVPEAVHQELGSKPSRFSKTKLMILILCLLFLGTLILIVALIFHLAKK